MKNVICWRCGDVVVKGEDGLYRCDCWKTDPRRTKVNRDYVDPPEPPQLRD